MMKASDLTTRQLADITYIERVSSILSLLGCLWIAITFLGSHSFQKPINRLVFYASVGNIFTNTATIMSRHFTSNPTGAGCQTQAFFIQMFLPADAVWTLAMAANVWLTFYHKFDSERLRRLEKWYFCLCYGLPFIPALVFLFIKPENKSQVYGNATLWCWISKDWEILRLACFYGPVWVVILATITIYLRAGRDIYIKRAQLRAFHVAAPNPLPIISDPFTNCKTTEVMVTSEAVTSVDSIDLQQLSPGANRPGEASIAKPGQSYQVTVTSQIASPTYEDGRWSYQEKAYSAQQPGRRSSVLDDTNPISPQVSNANNHAHNVPPARRYAAMEANNAAYSYTKVAVLFFLAMMITWIPSSANRVYSVVHPGYISLPLQFASAFVLPLQGFWNALIYTTTSLPACRQLWKEIRERKRMSGNGFKSMQNAFTPDREQWPGRRLNTRNGPKYSVEESESMTELHTNRPTTKDNSYQ